MNLDTGESDSDDAPPELVEAGTYIPPNQQEQEAAVARKVPITIVTGYLGAGKTTLLNYILSAQHGKKIAVILNGLYFPSLPSKFGDSAALEKALTISQDNSQVTEWISLANGCICCSVKDSGVAALESLMERQGAFDYILLETTGLADPGNIAPIFWVDDGLGSSIYLDGIVTVVDAVNVVRCLEEPAGEERVDEHEASAEGEATHGHGSVLTTAHLQISHADILLLNKSDLVSAAALETTRSRIQAINGLAKIITTTNSRVEHLEGVILDLHAYDSYSLSSGLLPAFQTKGHSHLDASISTRSFNLPPLHLHALPLLEEWLREVLWREGKAESHPHPTHGAAPAQPEIHRLKGILPLTDGSIKVIQGVREIFEISDCTHPIDAEVVDGGGKIVMIGRRLAGVQIPYLH